MNLNTFTDDFQESGIPMFGKNGTALSPEERAQIAKRRGLCIKCGARTHKKQFMGMAPITSEDAYQGICIRCNQGLVPHNILKEWKARNSRSTAAGRFRAAGNAVRAAHSASNLHASPGHRSGPVAAGTSLHRSGHQSDTRNLEPTRSNSRGSMEGGSQRGSTRSAKAGSSARGSGTTGGDAIPLAVATAGSTNGLQRKLSSHRPLRGSSSQSVGAEEFKTTPESKRGNILQELKANKDKPDVVRDKLNAIRNLSPDSNGSVLFAELKSVMEMYRGDPNFMMLSAGALWSISHPKDVKKKEAVSTGCLDLILEMMKAGKSSDEPKTVQWALGCFTTIARFPVNRNFISERRGIETILEAIKKHEKDPGVVEWGCRALFSMVGGFDEGNIYYDAEIAKIENYGGIRVIVGAMKLNAAESVSLWWAIKLLLKMQQRSDANAVTRSVQMMMREDDLGTICVRIIENKVSIDCLIQCQGMLMFLMSNASNAMLQHSAAECIPIIVETLGENPSNLQLVETSAEFLSAVARENLQAKRQIADCQILRLVIGGMKSSPKKITLQESIATLLWTLSADESSFDYSMLNDIKSALETAAKEHFSSKRLAQAICGFVNNTATHAKGATNAVPIDLVLKLATSGNAGSQGGKALSSVCAAFPDVATRVIQSGTCDRLLEGLCDSSIDVQSTSATTLKSLAQSSDVIRLKIIESGGLTTASAALLTTTSDVFAKELLLLVNVVLSGGSKKVIELPAEIVVTILHAANSFSKLKDVACITIRNLMLAMVPGSKTLSMDGLVGFLVGILDSTASSEELLMEASGTLWAYAARQPFGSSSVSSEVFRSALGVCSRHKGDSGAFNGPVLAEAAGALAAILHRIRDDPIGIADNDIDLIISILDIVIEVDVDNVTLMNRLLDAIFTLCFLSVDLLIQFGVIVVVIDCMVEHEGNEMIQQKGCAILALLASTENLQVNLSIAETDGIDMLVSALAGFSESLEIQMDACRALSHLSIDHESRLMISTQGGLILLVNAMNKYHDDLCLLEAAASALLNLSSDGEEHVLLGSGVVETIISTMKLHVDSNRLSETCLGVLQNISMRSKDAKRAISKAGGIGAVTFSIKEFMGTPSVLERSFTTMWSLAVLEDNQSLIASEDGISLVINGMMALISYETVQKQACGCLCTLSSNSQNKTLIRDLGGVDAIVYAMWAHYSSDGLLIEACRALSSLAVNVQKNEVMIASEGEINAILSGMRRFPGSERLQEHACVALRNFLLSPDNVDLVRPQTTEVEELVNVAASRFPQKCADRARQIMTSLHQ